MLRIRFEHIRPLVPNQNNSFLLSNANSDQCNKRLVNEEDELFTDECIGYFFNNIFLFHITLSINLHYPDIDECAVLAPCENGGVCINTVGSYFCNCMTGYSGDVCQICKNIFKTVNYYFLASAMNSATSGVMSTASSPHPTLAASIGCASSPCKNRGVCFDTATGYTCRCAPGFFGNTCDTACRRNNNILLAELIDSSSLCNSNHKQIAFDGVKICLLVEIDECASSPCQNQATCVDQINGFTCICEKGWNGTLCQNNIDDCVGATCQHGGTCVDGINSYSCNCQYGYSGAHCETREACHSVKADIMMLLDSSGSVGSANFQKQLKFVQSVANSFDIGQGDVHMGVVTFSTAPHPQFKLIDYQTKNSLINAISKIPYQSGSTHTDSAIDYLLKHSFTSQNGDRSDAPNIAVIITDGQSNNRQATIKEANMLHNRGITTVAIGIGSGINRLELEAIASNHSLVFTVANYDALHKLQGLVDHKICQVHLTHTSQPATNCTYKHQFHRNPTPPNVIAGNEDYLMLPKIFAFFDLTAKCEDKISNCYQYGVAACSSYRQWASDNCPKYCQFCSGRRPTTTVRNIASSIHTECSKDKWKYNEICMDIC
ncbi:hypothetical protein KUTeg_008782 [Tegillarca granosa]|uniref:Uncharacterized protein n=1 Tax=Tegillarca granosa TaxID=220873 RepID=A0ABQ9FC77_TEGGR|nr:hypothetical protein KUTeg_008782 [Tegillarca granosa]